MSINNNLCKCGCGIVINSKKKGVMYIHGHNLIGIKMSDETKRKIGLSNSISLKGNIPWNKGKKIGKSSKKGKTFEEMYGKEKADFLKKETSKRMIGHKVTNEHKLKIRNKMIGHKVTKETIKKIWETRRRNGTDCIPSKLKGKTYEEIYGIEESKKKKEQIRKNTLKQFITFGHPCLGKHPWLNGGNPKGMLGKKSVKKGKTYEEFYGGKKSKDIKEKIKESRAKQIFPKKDSSIEIKIQSFLSQLHLEFFTHKYMHIEHGYQCDIFIPKQETEGVIISQYTIIECDGCYWHGCSICNKELTEKQLKQIEKDKLRTKELEQKGIKVIRLFEHEINDMPIQEFERRIKNV